MKAILSTLFIVIISLNLTAQITITAEDYPIDVTASAIPIKIVTADATGIMVPQGGEDMVWDYTGLLSLTNTVNFLRPAPNPVIPNSNLKTPGRFGTLLNQSSYPAMDYYNYDSTGLSYTGRETSPSTETLGWTTGNFSDYLTMTGSDYINSTPIYRIKFPCNYGDSESFTIQDTFKYLVGVSMFNLLDYEVNEVNQQAVDYEVSGWGTLKLTEPNTQIDESFEVLLRTNTITTIDSFFEPGGDLVPSSLLIPFGLSQGMMLSTTVSYTFYVKGFSGYALQINTYNGVISSVYYNIDVFNAQTVGTNNQKPALISHTVFPNPVQNHQFQIQFEKTSPKDWQFELVNIIGQSVHQQTFTEGVSTVQAKVQLNNNLPKGSYFYTIRNEHGAVIANGSIGL